MARSAGILLYRFHGTEPELLVVHPGGPLWANRDTHAWSIPKGEYDPDSEDGLAAAVREFTEETGFVLPDGPPRFLGSLRQPSGKVVDAWAVEGSVDPSELVSNTFEMTWPPRSGRTATFPEVDAAAWVTATTAREKLHKGQVPLVDLLDQLLRDGTA